MYTFSRKDCTIRGDTFSVIKEMSSDTFNSSGDEIANVNFYAVHPKATRIR